MHETEFPNLAKMARDYLAVAGAGVLIERFFSRGVGLLPPKRHCMKPEKIQKCLNLKAWMKSSTSEFLDGYGKMLGTLEDDIESDDDG